MKKITIVIPCYNSEHTIRKVVEMVMDEFASKAEYECDFVLVNDGSKDDTFGAIRGLAKDYNCVKGINLFRNFGQHNALMAAINYATGDYVMGMDDDMQTHPSQIFKLVNKIEEGYDLVYGVYTKRKNSSIKNLTSFINAKTSSILLGRPKDIVSSNFWIITKKTADEVTKYNGYNPYVDGIFYRVTNSIGNVEIEHFKREVGTSNYTFKKLLKLWIAYWNYSVIPLRISTFVGIISAMLGFAAAIIVLIQKIIDPTMALGWSSTVCFITVFAGLILLSLGIVGEYLGKIMLMMNGTPQYIVREIVGDYSIDMHDNAS